MTLAEVKKLHAGDEVRRTDPDDGICSRTLTIGSIEFRDEVVIITDQEGSLVECFAHELS
jgi:hypothetical protein